MTDLKRQPFDFSMPRRNEAKGRAALKVERISHAARFLMDRAMDVDVVVLESADAVTPFIPAINELCAQSSDGNPLFEPTTLIAAMTHLQGKSPVQIALIWRKVEGDARRELIGLFPYFTPRLYLGLPVPVWSIWTHIHSFLATPVVRAGYELDAIRQFMDFADQSGATMVRFPIFQADGAFGPALAEIILERQLPTVETGKHERAFLKADMDGDTYLATHMRKKKRKEYNRLWNRLSETGALAFETPDANLDLTRWLQDFLQLERSGWKGKRGTALAERKNERAFFESMCRSAQASDKFHAAQMTLDGKPIAMLASFISGRGAYSFKIAFNEDYARFSPGALLMMKVIDAFHRDTRIDWVDSCAIPNHPMIDHIWAERRQIREVNLATSNRLSPWLVAYSGKMTRIADRVWAFLRQIYHRVRKEVERG
ncbi:MAG: GNAT family N-acetyltransferase [Parvibaculum sp.]